MSLVAVVIAVVVAELVLAIFVSTAVCTIRNSAEAALLFAFPNSPMKFGITTATRMPRIATTIRSSVSVNPASLFSFFNIVSNPRMYLTLPAGMAGAFTSVIGRVRFGFEGDWARA
jgi:hypothetical protein